MRLTPALLYLYLYPLPRCLYGTRVASCTKIIYHMTHLCLTTLPGGGGRPPPHHLRTGRGPDLRPGQPGQQASLGGRVRRPDISS